MLESTITIAGLTMQTFTFLILLTVLLSAGWLIVRAPAGERARTADVCLVAIVGGVLLARLTHVLLHPAYFADRPDDVVRLQTGGLSWQGAVMGALIAGWLMARLRRIAFVSLLNRAAFVLPLVALATWTGCLSAFCAFGAEVVSMADYPAWMTWEANDAYGFLAPRFSTQPVGMVLSGILLMLTILIQWRGWLYRWRFWMMLLCFSLLMLIPDSLRGDDVLLIAGLRAHLWLDGLLAGVAVFGLLLSVRPDYTDEYLPASDT